MRVPSGVTDQYVYFVAVDATDLKTRETGLTGFTVYRSRNGGAAAAMTTPTVNETDATNMPGVYELLLDEDMTIDAGDDSQEMCFHITQASMAPVTRVIELYRPKITAGNTLDVTATGEGGVDFSNINGTLDASELGADCITAAKIAPGAIAKGDQLTGLNDLSAAQVNAEVADVIKTDTIAEMAQGAPAATPTLEDAVMYIYMALRNKVDVTSTLKEFHNDAGTVIWKKTLSDDGTTYSEAKGVTGP